MEPDMARLIKIDNSIISERDWEEVDKSELARILEESGDEKASQVATTPARPLPPPVRPSFPPPPAAR
jgi:hypothetical protein